MSPAHLEINLRKLAGPSHRTETDVSGSHIVHALLQTFEDYIDRINLVLMTKSTTVDKLMRKIVKIQQLQNATE